MDESNNVFDADFASFESFSGDVEETNPVDDWNADFQSFEENAHIEEEKNICKPSVILSGLCVKCFQGQAKNVQKVTESIQDSYKSSLLSSSLQSQILDPIKPKSTSSYQLIVGQMQDLLDPNKVKANWLINVSEALIGTFRNDYDFHSLCKKKGSVNKSFGNRTSDKNKNSQYHHHHHPHHQSNGNIQRIVDNKPSTNGVVQNTKLQQPPHQNHMRQLGNGGVALPVNGSVDSDSNSFSMEYISNSSLPELEFSVKNSFEELSLKPIEELASLASELEIQAKIYSELLLSELDNRDDLQRQQEIMNNFISSHVAVERKISQNKQKQKSRSYGFFKHPEENKTAELTIPYFCQDDSNGPTIAELSLITEILKAIEREDPEAPKLISEYVFKLGSRFDLDTVIKVRTSSGVTPIESHGKS